MADPLEYPKLRWPIDIRLERIENQEVLLLGCPLGIAPRPLLLMPAVGPILGHFEGQLSVQEITQKFAAQGLNESVIRELIKLLDQNLFLVSPRYFAAEKAVKDDFKNSAVRSAALAGASYPSDPKALSKQVDGYMALAPEQKQAAKVGMIGLVSPHIDYRRGGECYGITYSRLKNHQHDVYVIMGTAHQYSRRMFHLTRKDFHTPLGNMPTDVGVVDTIAMSHGVERSFADEFLHRREHSLELQLPFLHRLKKGPSMVPILVGGFHHMLNSGKYPEQFDEYESFADALTKALAMRMAEGKRICLVAGVDMAHVGQSFGDAQRLTPDFMQKVRERDHAYLEAIKTHDRRKLFSHIAEDEDARRICGFPTMYTLLDVLERLGLRYSAEIFDYRQAVDYERDCAVTFAGIGLYSAHAPAGEAPVSH